MVYHKGLYLVRLLFLIYVNKMPMEVKCNLLLYANDIYLVFQGDNVKYQKVARSRFCKYMQLVCRQETKYSLQRLRS